MGVQVAPMFQKWKNYGQYFETILGGKVLRFYASSHPIFGILFNFLITEKTEKFLQILILKIFKLDFQIPGKILSGFLVRHTFWCLVTPMTPRGSPKSLITRKRVASKIHSEFCQESENQV